LNRFVYIEKTTTFNETEAMRNRETQINVLLFFNNIYFFITALFFSSSQRVYACTSRRLYFLSFDCYYTLRAILDYDILGEKSILIKVIQMKYY